MQQGRKILKKNEVENERGYINEMINEIEMEQKMKQKRERKQIRKGKEIKYEIEKVNK